MEELTHYLGGLMYGARRVNTTRAALMQRGLAWLRTHGEVSEKRMYTICAQSVEKAFAGLEIELNNARALESEALRENVEYLNSVASGEIPAYWRRHALFWLGLVMGPMLACFGVYISAEMGLPLDQDNWVMWVVLGLGALTSGLWVRYKQHRSWTLPTK